MPALIIVVFMFITAVRNQNDGYNRGVETTTEKFATEYSCVALEVE